MFDAECRVVESVTRQKMSADTSLSCLLRAIFKTKAMTMQYLEKVHERYYKGENAFVRAMNAPSLQL